MRGILRPQRAARRPLLAALALLWALETPAEAQPGGVISGEVVDGDTLKPVAAAVVSLAGPALPAVAVDRRPLSVLTDTDGRFAFTNLDAGTYAVTVTKGAYADGKPGRQRPGGDAPDVNIVPPKMSAEVIVPMWKYSVIAGTVVDEAGEPVVDLIVRTLRKLPGERLYAAAQTTFTDDRGAYRFGTLLPGQYFVIAGAAPLSASPSVAHDSSLGRGIGISNSPSNGIGNASIAQRLIQTMEINGAALASGRGVAVPPPVNSRLQLYPPTFYPAAVAPTQASPVIVGSGEERDGIDIQIAPARVARLSGVLLKDGAPIAMAALALVPANVEVVPPDVVAPSSITDSTGRFVFAGVTPGRYALRGSIADSEPAWVNMPIDVGADDLDGIVATTRAPLRVVARTMFEGRTVPAASAAGRFTPLPFVLEPVDGSYTTVSVSGSLSDQGFISLAGFSPGRYRLRIDTVPPGWMVKAAMLKGVDVSETAFDLSSDIEITIVYTDRISGVHGTVDAGADASVLLFPSDTALWTDAAPTSRRFRAARVDLNGEFEISAVPAGDYCAVAVPEGRTSDWRDRAALEALAPSATRLSIAEGETRIVALRVVKDAR